MKKLIVTLFLMTFALPISCFAHENCDSLSNSIKLCLSTDQDEYCAGEGYIFPTTITLTTNRDSILMIGMLRISLDHRSKNGECRSYPHSQNPALQDTSIPLSLTLRRNVIMVMQYFMLVPDKPGKYAVRVILVCGDTLRSDTLCVCTDFMVKKCHYSDVDTEETDQIAAFSLRQNYPNPFNPETDICYSLTKAENVKLTIYNILGQKIRTLVDEYQPAGTKTAHWDGKDENGNSVNSGIYFYRITAGQFSQTKKMVLMK